MAPIPHQGGAAYDEPRNATRVPLLAPGAEDQCSDRPTASPTPRPTSAPLPAPPTALADASAGPWGGLVQSVVKAAS